MVDESRKTPYSIGDWQIVLRTAKSHTTLVQFGEDLELVISLAGEGGGVDVIETSHNNLLSYMLSEKSVVAERREDMNGELLAKDVETDSENLEGVMFLSSMLIVSLSKAISSQYSSSSCSPSSSSLFFLCLLLSKICKNIIINRLHFSTNKETVFSLFIIF